MLRWLLRRLVNDDDRRAIESELVELYELRRRQDGEPQARRWLTRQQRLYPMHLIADRLRSAAADWKASMRHLWRDLTYSLRGLLRAPALTMTIVLTVGVGLGATTAMVSVVRAVLINPLPYAAPDALYWIYTDNPPFHFRFSVVDYQALEADHPAFSAIAAYESRRVAVSDHGAVDDLSAKAVTGSYFELLGQHAILGRLFAPADDRSDEKSVVLTHAYWTNHFGGDPSILGRAITIDDTAYTIIGVLERTDGPLESGVSLFTVVHWPQPTRKGPFFTTALGRLARGMSTAAAADALHATNRRLFPLWKSSYQDEKATWGLQDLKSRVVGETGSTLFLVLAAVGCVLLIACANAVNLLVARAVSRGRELAIRGALGASRARLLQHLFAETGVLTVAAALVGAGVAAIAMGLVTRYGPGYIPRLSEVGLRGASLGWLAALSTLSGLLIGAVPALHSARVEVSRALGAGGRSSTDGPGPRRLRRALVASEFALATPLIVAASLIATSLTGLSHVRIGIETDHLLTAGITLPVRYSTDEARQQFWDRARARFASLPGVEAAALATGRPPNDASDHNNFDLEDHPTPPGQSQPIALWIAVSPEFFRTVGLRLERGRPLDDHSTQNNEVVVDRAWAGRFFPGQDVVGRRLREGGCTTCPWTTVVGLVGTIKYGGLDTPDEGVVYYPVAGFRSAYVVIKATGDPATIVGGLRQAVKDLDSAVPLKFVATGADLVADALAAPRYLSVLVGMFAITALVLSVVGIYGVMAYFVQQHSRDIGIRLALGGDPSVVRRMVIGQGLRLVSVGVAIGLGAALLTARLMTSVLFGVGAKDPMTLTAVPAALLLSALIACLIPARRAARVDPAEILRDA